MPRESKAAALRRVFGEGTFTNRDLARLARLLREARYESGEALMSQDEEADKAFLIVDGRAEVRTNGTVIGTVGPGDWAGEMGLLKDAPRSATVTAVEPLRALTVDRAQFAKLVAEPELKRRITSVVSRRSRQAAARRRAEQEPATGAPSAGEDTLRAALDALQRRRVRRRRRRTVGAVSGLLVLVLLAGVTVRVLADRATPVAVDEAVARFRGTQAAAPAEAPQDGSAGLGSTGQNGTDSGRVASTGASNVGPDGTPAGSTGDTRSSAEPGSAATMPQPGVYVYDTKGFEEVSVLGGSRHEYPERTTMTVTANDCGFDMRWDALEERWDRWSTCSSGRAIILREFATYHEFFEQGDRKDYRCTPATRMRPERDDPGTSFAGQCRSSEEGVSDTRGTVIGTEDVTISGRGIPAVRVRLDQTLSGTTRGTRTLEAWYEVETNLLLRLTARTEGDAKSTLGDTRYREELTLQLLSLEPQR